MATITWHFSKLDSILADQKFVHPAGTLPLSNDQSVLYYGKKEGAQRRIDFLDATEAELQQLAEACDPATFGRGEADVYDESYRKAGKLDRAHFATNFHPMLCGLTDKITDILLKVGLHNKVLRAELYKLNVYGPGSFFKPHKDTPRGQDMYATLVIALPTAHEGGTLVFRRYGKEIGRFDSATAIAQANTSSFAFVAFYSDIEHEVEEVHAGYRVTLTYNLYLTPTPDPLKPPANGIPTPMVDRFASEIRTELARLLRDETFLPEGGLMGFGLHHEYPINTGDGDGIGFTSLTDLLPCLKGSDAVLADVCRQLNLETSLRVLYDVNDDLDIEHVLCDVLVDLMNRNHDEELTPSLIWCGGIPLVQEEEVPQAIFKKYKIAREDSTTIYWATPPACIMFQERYAAYGNEYWVGTIYASLCLVIDVDPYVHRCRVGSGDVVDESEDEQGSSEDEQRSSNSEHTAEESQEHEKPREGHDDDQKGVQDESNKISSKQEASRQDD